MLFRVLPTHDHCLLLPACLQCPLSSVLGFPALQGMLHNRAFLQSAQFCCMQQLPLLPQRTTHLRGHPIAHHAEDRGPALQAITQHPVLFAPADIHHHSVVLHKFLQLNKQLSGFLTELFKLFKLLLHSNIFCKDPHRGLQGGCRQE